MNVLSVGLIIGVVALFLTGINRSAVSIGSKNWPTVSGIITTSTYREIDQDIQIHYRYTVAGKEYEQTRVYQDGKHYLGRGQSWKSYAAILLRTYPTDANVTVHYKPDDPAQAYLIQDGMRGGIYMFFWVVFALAFCAISS